MDYKNLLLVPAITLSMLSVPAFAQITVHESGNVKYASGGVGQDSMQEIRAMEQRFNLKLLFAQTSGSYLSDVKVVILRDNQTVLETTSKGPVLLAQLAPGNYTISATYHDKSQQRTVRVPAQGIASADFRWQP